MKSLAAYSLEVDLIPRAKENECPRNTQYKKGLGTCSCEDHCGWDLCRLVVAPWACIEATHSKWWWDNTKAGWVAQVTQGNIVSIKTYTIDSIIQN